MHDADARVITEDPTPRFASLSPERLAQMSLTPPPPAAAAVPRPRRVFSTLRRMELTGSTLGSTAREFTAEPQWQRHGARTRFQTVADLPVGFLEALNHDDGREYERAMLYQGHKRGFAHLLREIYDIIDTPAPAQDKKQLRRLLLEIVQRVLEPHVLQGHMEPPSAPHGGDEIIEFVTRERERFLRLGGAECLLRVIHMIREEELEDAEDEAVDGGDHPTTAAIPTADAAAPHRRNVTDRHDIRSLWATPLVMTKNLDSGRNGVRKIPRPAQHRRHDAAARKTILNDAMGILRELCYFSLDLASDLCDKDGLIVYLFQLMGENKFFDNAAGLVEEILAVRDDSFDLSRIPQLHDIIASFSSRQLAFFCRVLALVVFEPDDRRLLETSKVIKSMELLKLRRNRLLRADNVVDRNHAIIFSSPHLLDRLLTVLKVQNYYFAVNPIYEPFSNELATSAEFAMLLSQTSDRSDWEAIDRLVSSPHLPVDGEFSVLQNTSRPTIDPHHDHEHHHHGHSPFSIETAILRDLIFRNRSPDQRAREDVEAQIIMKSIVLAPYRVEVLFVLCTLLNGKRKIDFQDKLAQKGLVDSLSKMFDKFQWNSTPPPSSQQPLHGPGCGCSLDASLKIQFLRLIHNFCDRDYNDNTSKLLLLSPMELDMLIDPDLRPISLIHSDKGLLCKIIETLIHQPADSIYRFWLSSCVEAFLRRAAPTEQLFVARTPLLRSLVDEILSGGGYRAQGSFQSAFDLLGEMTKGNWQTLDLFHRQLDAAQFANFMEVVIRNLVDSNVFVRSMLLSAEKFAKAPTSGIFGLADDFTMDRMSMFLTLNVVRLLKDLMTIVSLNDVNHENICCLNTAIVILIFQHRRQRLPEMLEALRALEDLSGKAGYVCRNFRALLWFWIQYYTPRGRDRLSLEHSSDILFAEWRDVVALLCADDGSSTALLTEPMPLPASPYSRLYSSHCHQRRHERQAL